MNTKFEVTDTVKMKNPKSREKITFNTSTKLEAEKTIHTEKRYPTVDEKVWNFFPEKMRPRAYNFLFPSSNPSTYFIIILNDDFFLINSNEIEHKLMNFRWDIQKQNVASFVWGGGGELSHSSNNFVFLKRQGGISKFQKLYSSVSILLRIENSCFVISDLIIYKLIADGSRNKKRFYCTKQPYGKTNFYTSFFFSKTIS